MRKEVKKSDWDLLEVWIDQMEPNKLLTLTERTRNFSPTQQIKLLRSAAEKLRAREAAVVAVPEDIFATSQGEEETEHCIKHKSKRKRSKTATTFAKRQGEELCEDEVDE